MIRKLIRRRDPRFFVREAEPLSVLIQEGEQSTTTIQATLVDLSCGGAKLRVSQELPIDAKLTFRIEAPELAHPIDAAADICWTRIAAVGSDWWLGCSFKPRIPEEVIQRLAVDGFIERRGGQRLSTKINVAASYETGTERVPVRIIDLSSGGFCLVSPAVVSPGSRILLRIEITENGKRKEKVIAAKSRWQVQSDEEGYVIGCEFINTESHFTLRMLGTEESQEEQLPFWKRLFRMSS